MRNFNVHPNNSNLKPGVNLNKLWSLVSEQVLTNRMIATSYDQPLLIDLSDKSYLDVVFSNTGSGQGCSFQAACHCEGKLLIIFLFQRAEMSLGLKSLIHSLPGSSLALLKKR